MDSYQPDPGSVRADFGGTNLFDFWRHHANIPLHAPPTATQEFKP